MNKYIKKIGNSWKMIRVLLSMLVFAGLMIFIIKEFVPSRDTYGSIFVDSPEVYTRERLVNDRFLQDAWLNRWLELKGGKKEFSGNKSYLNVLNSIKASIGKPENNNVDESPENSAQLNTPSLSTRDVLVDMVDFREQVRNFKIENQLDDRHDLKGNTLYRLKFDATIIPGNSTRALAKIDVKLKGPECIKNSNGTFSEDLSPVPEYLSSNEKKECRPSALKNIGTNENIEKLRVVYRRWLSNLQARLNQTHREQKQAYYNNQFKKTDYYRLRKYFETYHNIDLISVEESKCCEGASISKEQNDDSEQVNPYLIDHPAQQKCIRAIVRSIIKNKKVEKVPRGEYGVEKVPRGEYGSEKPSVSKENTGTTEPGKPYQNQITELKISQELEQHLNSFLASKTLQLVLGIKIPQLQFQQLPIAFMSQLDPLTKISFFNSVLDTHAYKVFFVEERIPKITGISPDISEKFLQEIIPLRNEQATSKKLLEKFFEPFNELNSQSHVEEKKLLIWKRDAELLKTESYQLAPCEFSEVKQGSGVYVAEAEVGLRNFANYAHAQTKTYAYAVTPKMHSENQYSSFQWNTGVGGDILSWLKNIRIKLGRAEKTRTVNRKGTVVGFSEATGKKEADFGWVTSPRLSTADSREKIHTPVQESLSALISLPSWWNKAQLTVTTHWVGRDGKAIEGQSRENSYEIDLPANYEQLEADMLQLQQLGPELMESVLDPIRLTACKPGAIVIPGGRLWRSTVVTLGYQTADRIIVLPNMKGIIARFDTVENQMSVAEEKKFSEENTRGIEIRRAVRVWTSQGTVALPQPAWIGIPNSWREECATEASKKNGE